MKKLSTTLYQREDKFYLEALEEYFKMLFRLPY